MSTYRQVHCSSAHVVYFSSKTVSYLRGIDIRRDVEGLSGHYEYGANSMPDPDEQIACNDV